LQPADPEHDLREERKNRNLMRKKTKPQTPPVSQMYPIKKATKIIRETLPKRAGGDTNCEKKKKKRLSLNSKRKPSTKIKNLGKTLNTSTSEFKLYRKGINNTGPNSDPQ